MTSERTMNQVRAILNKLDRSIDEARERRTQPAEPVAATAPKVAPVPQPERAAASVLTQPGQAAEGTVRPNSPFGRAQPLNRSAPPAWRT